MLELGASFLTDRTFVYLPPPKKKNPFNVIAGREWKAVDLRRKSWDDLHRLWFVLLKERNRLQSEKLAYAQVRRGMPDPARLMKVRKSMNRIKQVMAQRISEHEDPTIKTYLKGFIDSM